MPLFLNVELSDYFKMEQSIREAEEDKANMKNQFNEHQAHALEKEAELQEKLKEADGILHQWIEKEASFNEKYENEIRMYEIDSFFCQS